jgi:uncharacterized membrane protein
MGFFRELFKENSTSLRYYIPFGLMLISIFWKFNFIDYRDISMDEPFTIYHAQKDFKGMTELLSKGEPTPPLFMFLMHYWIKLFGLDPIAVRSLPLLFNTLTIPIIYSIGLRFFNVWTGFVAAALFILSEYQFFAALEARTYSLMSLFVASSLYFYLIYLDDIKNKRAMFLLIMSNLLLVYSHYFGWYVIVLQLIFTSVFSKSIKNLLWGFVPVITTGIGFLPLLPLVLDQFFHKSKVGTFLMPPDSSQFLNQLYHFLNHKSVLYYALYIIAAGVLFFLFLLLTRRVTQIRKELLVLFLWWIIPYSFMFLVSSKVPMFSSKYVLFNTIGFYLFIPAFFSFLFQKRFKWINYLGCIIMLTHMGIKTEMLPDTYSYREIRKAVDFASKYKTDESIFILHPYWSDLLFLYHYDRDVFTETYNLSARMKENSIYNVWGLSHAKQVVEANPGKRVIILQDGIYTSPEANLYSHFDTIFSKVDSGFFPQITFVKIYDPKQ